MPKNAGKSCKKRVIVVENSGIAVSPVKMPQPYHANDVKSL